MPTVHKDQKRWLDPLGLIDKGMIVGSNYVDAGNPTQVRLWCLQLPSHLSSPRGTQKGWCSGRKKEERGEGTEGELSSSPHFPLTLKKPSIQAHWW